MQEGNTIKEIAVEWEEEQPRHSHSCVTRVLCNSVAS